MVIWPCHFGLVVASYIILLVRKDEGEERPVGGIAAERDRVRKEGSQTGTQTHTQRRDQTEFWSLFQEHMRIELTCLY